MSNNETSKRAERRQQTLRIHKRRAVGGLNTEYMGVPKYGRKHACRKAKCAICHYEKVLGIIKPSVKKRIESLNNEL